MSRLNYQWTAYSNWLRVQSGSECSHLLIWHNARLLTSVSAIKFIRSVWVERRVSGRSMSRLHYQWTANSNWLCMVRVQSGSARSNLLLWDNTRLLTSVSAIKFIRSVWVERRVRGWSIRSRNWTRNSADNTPANIQNIITLIRSYIQEQDTFSNKHKVSPMPLHIWSIMKSVQLKSMSS